MALAVELGHSYAIVISQVGLAAGAARGGRGGAQVSLLGAADALLATTRGVLDPAGQAEYPRARAAAADLAPTAWAAAYAAGQAMTQEEAIAYALVTATETTGAGDPVLLC